MRRLRFVFVSVVLLAPLVGDVAGQQGVWVRGREAGQALLRGRGSQCFAIAPEHVIMGSQQSPPPVIRLVGVYGIEGSASHETSFPNDLAVIELEEGDLRCAAWSVVPNGAVVGAAGAYLRIVDESGAERAVPVEITSGMVDYLNVRPTDPSNAIVQGMSGASLMVSGSPVGMLLSVCQNADECVPGEGDVVRLDALARLTDGFFSPADASVETARAMEMADFQARAAAMFDSVSMAQRSGRPADLPTLKRDVTGLALIPTGGPLPCDVLSDLTQMDCEMEVREYQKALTRAPEWVIVRQLNVALALSGAVLYDAPPLPDPVAQCELLGPEGPVRTFPVTPGFSRPLDGGVPEASVHLGLAWGDGEEALPPGEYWAACAIDGEPFETNRLELSSPSLPWGHVRLGSSQPGEEARATLSSMRVELGDQRVDLAPEGTPLHRVEFRRPRQVSAAMVVSFDIVPGPAGVPAGTSLQTEIRCGPPSFRQMSREVSEQADGTWHAEVTLSPSNGRWDGPFMGICTLNARQTLFSFRVDVR